MKKNNIGKNLKKMFFVLVLCITSVFPLVGLVVALMISFDMLFDNFNIKIFYFTKKIFLKIKNVFNLANIIPIICAVIYMSVFIIYEFKPKENIQTVKVKRKINYEYRFLKKCFPWLNEKVYIVIKEESESHNIDPKYLMSVIQYESGDYCHNNWDQMQIVVSHAGAIGVCQIMPFHTRHPKKLYDWRYNISKGAWYLGQCLKSSDGNTREAARKYNQGLYGKRWKYRNWAYVNKISRKYKQVLTKEIMAVCDERN